VIQIVVLCMCAAVLYGLVHDQFTVRLCLEYFTIAHPAILENPTPSQLALAWGFLATWWVGLILGALLACAARVGEWPKLRARQLLPDLGRLLGRTAACAFLAAVAGYWLHESGALRLTADWQSEIHPDRLSRFQSAWFAHLTSYGIAFLSALWLVYKVMRKRSRLASK